MTIPMAEDDDLETVAEPVEHVSLSDDEFRDEDGKLPLASIEHNGQTWRVGK